LPFNYGAGYVNQTEIVLSLKYKPEPMARLAANSPVKLSGKSVSNFYLKITVIKWW
jgi:hypothetical protein